MFKMADGEESSEPTCGETKTSEVHKKKEKEPGIIYLSRIPTGMTVLVLRRILSEFGETDRIFLQPDPKAPPHKKLRSFVEGWVEFLDKRRAKWVANMLNRQPIKSKKSSPWHAELWNIKYLPKFKWAHLSERLAYERAVHQQRLRTEITQAKREANFFIQNVDRNKARKRREKRKGGNEGQEVEEEAEEQEEGASGSDNRFAKFDRDWTFRQRETEDEILSAKRRKVDKDKKKGSKGANSKAKDSEKSLASNKSFLKNLFSGGNVE